MVSLTLSVPRDLKERMDRFDFVNWSAVARDSIEKRLDLMERFKEFTKDSTLTQEDAIRLGREVNKGLAKRHMEAMEKRRLNKP